MQLRHHDEVGFSLEAIKEYIKEKSCPQDFKACYSKIFSDNLKDFNKSKFEEGLIHGDLYYDNTLFHNNRLNCLLDFEQSGKGPLILDIGISISGTCLEKGTINSKLIESFLLGYESKRQLPQIEKKVLNQAILLGLLSIALWRIKRFKEGDLDKSREDSYQELLQRSLTYHHLLEFNKNA